MGGYLKNFYKLLYVIELITENSGSKKKISNLCLGHYAELGSFADEVDNIELINSLIYKGGFIWESRANSQIIETIKLQRYCEETESYKDFCKKSHPVLYAKTKSFEKLGRFFSSETKAHLGQARQSSAKTKQYMVTFNINIEEDHSIKLLNQADDFVLGFYDEVEDAVSYLEGLFKNLNDLQYCGDYKWETIKPYHTEHAFRILELCSDSGEYEDMVSDLTNKKMEDKLRSISW